MTMLTVSSCKAKLVVWSALSAFLLGACGGGSTESSTVPAADLPGREVYLRDNYCVGCHTTLGGPATGPTFLGLAGSEVELESGETVVADDEYLRRAIVDPNAQIVAGFAPDLMPDFFGDTLSEQDIVDIIEYIKSFG